MKHILLITAASLAVALSSCEEIARELLEQNDAEAPNSITSTPVESVKVEEISTDTPVQTNPTTPEDPVVSSIPPNEGETFTGEERSTSQVETVDEDGRRVTEGSTRNTNRVTNVNGEDVFAPEVTNTTPAAIVDDIQTNVNAYRLSIGLNAVILDDFLSGLAADHSKNVAMGISTALEGFEAREAAVTAQFGTIGLYGENTAENQTNGEGAVNQWLNTPRQKADIENSAFTHTGIGSYQDASGTIYYTQIYLEL